MGAVILETMRQIPKDIVTPEGACRAHVAGLPLVTKP